MQLFESHAGALDHTLFVKFALPYIRVISKRVRDKLKERNVPCVPMVNLFLYIINYSVGTKVLYKKSRSCF